MGRMPPPSRHRPNTPPKAWKNGGNTNPKNLTVACPYHNGINDDDPSKPRRGRLERVNGKVRRIPPWATTYHTTTNQPT